MQNHDENDEISDVLDQLAALGYGGGEAVDALMCCEGDVTRAAEFLTNKQETEHQTKSNQKKNNTKKTKKQQKKKNRKDKSKIENNNTHDSDSDTSNNNNNDINNSHSSGKSSSKETVNKQQMSFQERRKAEIEARKAKRYSKLICRVCGGPHPRRECPGLLDDGRGQARWHDPAARIKDARERRDIKDLKQKISDVQKYLTMGLWTQDIPYYDGFADLYEVFVAEEKEYNYSLIDTEHNNDNDDNNNSETSAKFLGWMENWAKIQVELGKDPSSSLENLSNPQEIRKKELKLLRVKVLKEQARSALESDEDVDSKIHSAMESGNPKSELIKIILASTPAVPSEEISSRDVKTEWPGYRGCVTPISVLNTDAFGVVEYLKQKTEEDDGQLGGVKVLLAIPPDEVAKWMITDDPNYIYDNAVVDEEKLSSPPCPSVPLDLTIITRTVTDVQQLEADFLEAKKRLLTCPKKQKAKVEAKVKCLRKDLESKQALLAESEALLSTSANARLDPSVEKTLDAAIMTATSKRTENSNETEKRVIGVSCGLDYRTPSAVHPKMGNAVRKAQREACEYAVNAAAKAGLPIVLECHDAPVSPPVDTSLPDQESSLSANVENSNENDTQEQISPASSDLVRILVKAAPPDSTLVLRCGSLTTAQKPGLQSLLDVWPKLFVGLSSSLTHSKCPKELLDVAYDLPIERLILTSEAPTALPAMMGGSKKLSKICNPPYIACAAEQIAKIKSSAASDVDREEVLRVATHNLRHAFGMNTLEISQQGKK